MANINVLRKRLESVNTQLNAIEEGWPRGMPSNKASTLVLDHSACKLPKYAITMMQIMGKRLQTIFPVGWDFKIYACVWGGQDAGCIMEIFINGSSFASARFCVGDAMGLNTKADCVAVCVDQFPTLVNNSIARLKKYPRKTFASEKYKNLCERRRKLNQQWHAIPETHYARSFPPYAYPYGKHKEGWPVFEGMQLGI